MPGVGSGCPGCGGESWREMDPADRSFRLSECLTCGGARMDLPRPEPAQLYAEYYAGTSSRRVFGPLDAVWGALRRAKARRILAATRPGARVLDIGCERGELLNVLRAAGCEVRGTQIAQAAADFARRRFGIEVFVGELADAPFAGERFDAVLMLNVLEHLPEPETYVAHASRLLADDGVLVLELPNVRSFSARFSQKRWLHADPLHHFWGFSQRGLSLLLARNGLRIDRIDHWSVEHGPIGVVQSLLNYLPGSRNVLFDLMTTGPAPRPTRLGLQAVHLALGAVLFPLGFVVAAVEALAGNGQVVTVFATRAEGGA